MRGLPVSLFVTLLVAASGCKKTSAEQAAKPPPAPPVPVETAIADVAPSPLTLTLTGLISADQRSEVTADSGGKVIAVLKDRGDRVKMGEPVVRLDVRTAAASAREAQANLAAARAQKGLAEEECRRAQTLLDKGAITRSEYDRQRTQCDATMQQVAAAQARTEMIAQSVADGLVRAPFDGVIADKMTSPGEWVAPGRPLFTLVDDDPLKIDISVSEKTVRAIAPGQKVRVVATGRPDLEYMATVTRIGAEIGRTRSMKVTAVLDKESKPTGVDALASFGGAAITDRAHGSTTIVPGMFAEARVVIGYMSRPVLPADAIVKRGKTHHAFVVVAGEVQDRVVQLGEDPAPGQRAIVSGLVKGDVVVRKVTDKIVDGLLVSGPGIATAATTPIPATPATK